MTDNENLSMQSIAPIPIPGLRARPDDSFDSYRATSPRFMSTSYPEQASAQEPTDFSCGSEGHSQPIRITGKGSPPGLSLAGATQRLNWLNQLKRYKRFKHWDKAFFLQSKRAHIIVQAEIRAIGKQKSLQASRTHL